MFIINPYRFGSTPTYLLDTYTGETAAYSLRILKSSFASSAPLRIVRSGDLNEADVFFDNTGYVSLNSPVGNKSTASPSTTLGGFINSAGFGNPDGLGSAANANVSIFRDQSGNNYHLLQNTPARQPKLAVAGVLQTTNGHVALLFELDGGGGNEDSFNATAIPTVTNANITIFAVGRQTTAATGTSLGGVSAVSNTNYVTLVNSNSAGNPQVVGFNTNTGIVSMTNVTNPPAINSVEYSYYLRTRPDGFVEVSATDTTSTSVQVNVIVSASSVSPSINLNNIIMSRRQANSFSNFWQGPISEMVVYTSNQSTNRLPIQLNQITSW